MNKIALENWANEFKLLIWVLRPDWLQIFTHTNDMLLRLHLGAYCHCLIPPGPQICPNAYRRDQIHPIKIDIIQTTCVDGFPKWRGNSERRSIWVGLSRVCQSPGGTLRHPALHPRHHNGPIKTCHTPHCASLSSQTLPCTPFWIRALSCWHSILVSCRPSCSRILYRLLLGCGIPQPLRMAGGGGQKNVGGRFSWVGWASCFIYGFPWSTGEG